MIEGHVLFYQGQSSKTHYILMFWGHTLEVLNRPGKVVKWSKVKVKRFYQGQSSKTPKM